MSTQHEQHVNMLRQQFSGGILVRMKKLRQWIQQQRPPISQAEFARRIGKDRFTVNRWVRGKVKPGPEHLEMLSKATGLPVEELRR
jgi:transcriptional regulator with XRE-family HTH domain